MEKDIPCKWKSKESWSSSEILISDKTLSGMPCSCTLLSGSGLTLPPPQAGPVEAITTSHIQLHMSWPFYVEGRGGRLWCRGRLTSPVWKQLICSVVGKHEHSERSRDKQGKEGSGRIWSWLHVPRGQISLCTSPPQLQEWLSSL